MWLAIVQFSFFRARISFAFAGSIDRDAIEHIRFEPNEMSIAQVVRLGVQDLFDFLGQRVDGIARSETNVNLFFLFFRDAADLQSLPCSPRDESVGPADLSSGSEKRDRTAWFGQSVGMQIAAIVGHEFFNARSRDLREKVVHFLIVRPRVQRLHDLPMVRLSSAIPFRRLAFLRAHAKLAPSLTPSTSGRENLPAFSRSRF